MQNKIIDHISFDIRNILPPISEPVRPEELIDNIPVNQYLEKADEINQLNLGNSDKLHEDISYIIKMDDANLKAVGLGCLTGIHTFNGNYKKAITSITQALSLKLEDEVSAYILTEYANLLRQLKRIDESLAVLDQAMQITKNEKLKWRIRTYQGYCFRYTDKDRSLNLLKRATRYYLDNNEHTRYITILRHISAIYLMHNDFKQAKQYLFEAKELSKRYYFQSIYWDIINDLGWFFIREKEYQKAENTLSDILKIDKDPYLNSLVIQNLAYIEFERTNYKKAIDYHLDSLRITAKYEIFEMLFEDYYKLGLANEKIGNYQEAEKYYSIGYKQLQQERKELGIILLAGFRRKLIDNYIRFLSYKPTIKHVSKYPNTFDFIEGKTYTDILGVFQKHLLSLHRIKTKTVKEICNNLDISVRLYFVYQNRFGISKKNINMNNIGNQHFINYLFSMLSLDWRSAIKKFDSDLYRYLLNKYNYNKTRIAEILDVSILTVINKTANI